MWPTHKANLKLALGCFCPIVVEYQYLTCHKLVVICLSQNGSSRRHLNQCLRQDVFGPVSLTMITCESADLQD